jgi:formylglycine-generating enzyme required for sulfatase activity
LVALGLAGWWFGVELPERRAAAELKRQQAEKSFRIADLNLDMVWIPSGEFRMGTPEQSTLAKWYYDAREKLTKEPNPGSGGYDNDERRERPMMWVTLTQPYWLGRTEVTQAQWTVVMGSNPSNFKGNDLPVDTVLWDESMEFCRKLTERERASGRLPAGYAYTLPTEAQWEYACRAGTTGNYAGDLDAMAWYEPNSGGTTHPVGTKKANGWGLSDMHGNVFEWCLDWYDDKYRGGEVKNPRGPASGSKRVLRGGCWYSEAERARSATRASHEPGVYPEYGQKFGFRLALAPAPQAPASPAVSVP